MKRPPEPVILHFPDGIVAIIGETKPRRISLCILGEGNPAASLRVSGSVKEMGRLFAAGGRIVLAVAKRGR